MEVDLIGVALIWSVGRGVGWAYQQGDPFSANDSDSRAGANRGLAIGPVQFGGPVGAIALDSSRLAGGYRLFDDSLNGLREYLGFGTAEQHLASLLPYKVSVKSVNPFVGQGVRAGQPAAG